MHAMQHRFRGILTRKTLVFQSDPVSDTPVPRPRYMSTSTYRVQLPDRFGFTARSIGASKEEARPRHGGMRSLSRGCCRALSRLVALQLLLAGLSGAQHKARVGDTIGGIPVMGDGTAPPRPSGPPAALRCNNAAADYVCRSAQTST